MVNDELLQYIREGLQRGNTREALTQELLASGWPQATIGEAFQVVARPAAPNPPADPALPSAAPTSGSGAYAGAEGHVAARSNKSYIVALLLSMFLGGLGVDRFYLGRIGTGIAKLVTFGGFGVWAFIDVFLIYLGKLRGVDGAPLAGYPEQRKVATVLLVFVIVMPLISLFFMIRLFTSGPTLTVHEGATVTTTSSFTDNEGNTTTTTSTTTGGEEGSTEVTTNTSQAGAPATLVNIGESVRIEDFDVVVTAVTPNPSVSGDAPDPGKKYVQIDVSFVNNGSSRMFVPNDFFYRTSSGEYLHTATTSVNGVEGKQITLSDGREVLVATVLDPGASDTNHSIVFQVPAGDMGSLVFADALFASSIEPDDIEFEFVLR